MLNLTDTQKSCPHVFIGKADGVHCTRCGLHLTPQQYHELLHPSEQATVLPEGASLVADEIFGSSANPGVIVAMNAQIVAPKAAQDAPSNANDKEPIKPEKDAQTATEPPQAKPKRARKKKEATP